MAPPTKTRACAFAGRAGPRRRSAPSRAAAAITPARRQSLPPAFTRGRNTRAVSQLRGRTAVEGSRTPTPSRAEDVDLRDTDHGEPKEPREIKAASRTTIRRLWCGRRTALGERIEAGAPQPVLPAASRQRPEDTRRPVGLDLHVEPSPESAGVGRRGPDERSLLRRFPADRVG